MLGKIAKSGLKRAMGLDNQGVTRNENPVSVASPFTSGDTNNSPTGHMAAYPYRSATLQYPLDIQTRQDLGHYMMFYINVINEEGRPGMRGSDNDRFAKNDVDMFSIGSVTKGAKSTYATRTMSSVDLGETVVALKTVLPKYATTGAKGKSNPPSAHFPTNMVKGKVNEKQIEKRPARTGLNSSRFGKNRMKRTEDCIVLYMPNQLTTNYSSAYREGEIGSLLGGGVMAAGQMITGGIGGQLANFGNVLGKALKDPFSAQAQQSVVDSAVDIANNLNSTAVPYALGAVSDLALGALNQASKAAGIGDIRGGYDKLSNRQMNQFLEAMFTGIGFRKFSYMFKFAPKSVEEAQEVDAIIRMFKFHMLPEIPMNDFGRYFRTPSDFDIHYMFRGEENTFLNKLATCVCLNVDVNYTPNGYQTMRPMRGRPGAPMSQIDMKLDFMETELITKEKILEGF